MKWAILLVPLLCSCPSIGSSPEEARVRAHNLRVALEPVLEGIVARENDPNLTEAFEKARVVADEIGVAWDAWLATGADGDDLVAKLHAGLDAADALVPLLTSDDDRAFYARSVIAILKVIVLNAAQDIGDAPTIERAEALAQ